MIFLPQTVIMLDAIKKNTTKVNKLKDTNDCSKSLIGTLEGRMTQTSEQLHVNMDCGAILAGTNFREFSQSLLNKFKDDRLGAFFSLTTIILTTG